MKGTAVYETDTCMRHRRVGRRLYRLCRAQAGTAHTGRDSPGSGVLNRPWQQGIGGVVLDTHDNIENDEDERHDEK